MSRHGDEEVKGPERESESNTPSSEAAIDPYQTPRSGGSGKVQTHPILWLAIFGILAKATALGIFFFPTHTIAIVGDFFVACCLALAFARPRILGTWASRRPTVFEVLVVVGICCLLHLLLVPAVQM